MSKKYKFNPNINICDLPVSVTDLIQETLDNNPESSNWRAFIKYAGSQYREYIFTKQEVENKFGGYVFRGSPADKMIYELGSRGMVVKELVEILDHLHLEKVLEHFKTYEPLQIIRQPALKKVIQEGDTLELEVKATGFPYPRYQWFKLIKNEDYDEIQAATESTLKNKCVRRADSGTYCCRLHNGPGEDQCLFTEPSTVTVEPKPCMSEGAVEKPPCNYDDVENLKATLPRIPVQPQPVQSKKGENVVLKCEAIGQAPLEYSWTKNGSSINAWSHRNVFQIPNASVDDGGIYTCLVRNPFGEVETEPFRLTILESVQDPVGICIITHPKTQTVKYGESCLFSVRVANQEQTLSYQWFKDGQTLPNETGQDLILRNLQDLTMQGSYQCKISSHKTTCLSNCASLRIQAPNVPEQSYDPPKDKVALLIGNFDYINEEQLKNAPKNDVQTLSEMFNSLGFKVVSLLNLTKIEMESAIQEFINLLGKGVYGVFYYCGHGFEEDGRCYFVPPDAKVAYTIEDCVSSDDVHNAMQKPDPAMVLLILDICRTKNKVKSPEMPKSTLSDNSLVVKGNSIFLYATSEGMFAFQDKHNGILVQYLQRHIMQPKSVVNVFMDVQDEWGREHKHKRIQIPEMKSNLFENKRSLADPVASTGYTQAYKNKTLLWRHAHETPPPQRFGVKELGMEIEVSFDSHFSNIIEVITTVLNPGSTVDAVAYIIGWTNQISLMGDIMVVSRKPVKTLTVLQDLQKLKEDLIVDVVIKYKVRGDPRYYYNLSTKLNFKKPLISKLNLWKKKSNEPMEHVEEMESAAYSSSLKH